MIGTLYFQRLEEMAELPHLAFLDSSHEDFRRFYEEVFKPEHLIRTASLKRVSCYYCLQNIREQEYVVIDEITEPGDEKTTNFHEGCFDNMVLNPEQALYRRHLEAKAALSKN